MPYKSKRNRRNIPKNKSGITSPITSNPEMTTQTANSQPERVTSSRGATAAASNYPFLLNDLKWTGVVTGVIIVILIVTYIIFH